MDGKEMKIYADGPLVANDGDRQPPFARASSLDTSWSIKWLTRSLLTSSSRCLPTGARLFRGPSPPTEPASNAASIAIADRGSESVLGD